MAANRGHLDIVSLLLSTGVDVDEQSNGGRTALWLACRWGHVNVAAALLRGGADYTLGTKDCDYGTGGDKSPKDVAMEHGYADVVAVIEVREMLLFFSKRKTTVKAEGEEGFGMAMCRAVVRLTETLFVWCVSECGEGLSAAQGEGPARCPATTGAVPTPAPAGLPLLALPGPQRGDGGDGRGGVGVCQDSALCHHGAA